MDRQEEERELQLADLHLAEARARISEQEARIASGRLLPDELALAQELLETMRSTLTQFEEHRAHIAQVIEAMDKGRR